MVPDGCTTASLVLAATAVYAIYRILKRNVNYLADLDERAVLVTGCDTGFGHEVARRLDSLGVTVFAGCLFPDGLGATQLKEACSNKLHILQFDVTNDKEVEHAVDFVKNSLKDRELWAVVNNAGIIDFGNLEWSSVDDVANMLKVNTLGSFRVTKAFLPFIRKSRGRLVFVASIACQLPAPSIGAYNISKHGVFGLAETLRMELKVFGVTVHTIKPTMYRTNLNRLDVMHSKMTDKWNKLSTEMRSQYGEEYFKDCKNSVEKSMNALGSPEEKVYEVVDDMVHAAIGACPKYNYVPGKFGKLLYFVFLIAPVPVQEFLVTLHFVRQRR